MHTSTDYPLLHAKAANTGFLLAFLAPLTAQWSSEDPGNKHKAMVASCIYGIADFLHLLRTEPRYLSEAGKSGILRAGTVFLSMYSALAREACSNGMAGRRWHIVQKHHYMCHLTLDAYNNGINPAYHHCFMDEDFVGRIAANSRLSHRSTCAYQTLIRYLSLLDVRWEGLEVEF